MTTTGTVASAGEALIEPLINKSTQALPAGAAGGLGAGQTLVIAGTALPATAVIVGTVVVAGVVFIVIEDSSTTTTSST